MLIIEHRDFALTRVIVPTPRFDTITPTTISTKILQSSPHNLRNASNFCFTHKFLDALQDLDASVRIGKIDRTYLDCRSASHEKFERIVRIRDAPYAYNRNQGMSRAQFSRH